MLTHLTIENYALIKSLDIDFSSGFTVITGETGAGKSILLGALGLILGQRADSQVLFFKDKKCTVESVFDISDLNLDDFFQLYDLEDSCIDNSLILRREIFPNGKSRAFINDSPVSVSILKEFSVRLIDIHSQHQTLTLTNSAFQLKLVDSYSADAVLIEAYANKYKEYKVLEKEIAVLDGEQKKLQEEEDYLRFVYTELDDLHAQAGEQQEMENNLRILEHGQQIKTTLLSCSEELQANEYSLISRLENTSQNLKKISTYHVGIQTMLPRWEALLVELKDLNTDLEKWGEDLQVDENIRQKYEQRLDLIYRLEAKHHLQTVEELIELKDSISLKLSKISSCDDQLQNLKKQYAIVEKKLKELSSQLHMKRVEAAALLEKQVLSALLNLGMGSSRLQISIVPTNTYTTTGTDQVHFLFNANLGGELKEIAKVVSGGELSRLMLAIKSVIHHKSLLSCIVFDEIDTGVSGEIAGKVGRMMRKMADCMQVVAVTHLPQIAAMAHTHLHVLKKEEEGHTISYLQCLDQEAHLQTVAAMISNGKITQAALKAAEELIKE